MKRTSKKLLSVLLVLAMVVSLLTGLTSFASAEEAATPIGTAAEFASMSANGNYILTSNITISAAYATTFTGTFNGGGKTITLAISNTSASAGNVALFANNAGTITNLTVAGSVTASGSNTDYAAAVAANNSGTISSVTNSANVTATGMYNVGGIAGYNTGSITGCSNNGNITGYAKVGGIVGENAGTINACYNIGNITGTQAGKSGIGGIAGRNGDKEATTTGTISNAYNLGKIVSGVEGQSETQGSWIGGICGFQNSNSTCTNCYNTGILVGYAYRDHTAGKNENVNDDNENIGVINCYGLDTGTGAQGYDETNEVEAGDMKETSFLNALKGTTTGVWTQTSGSYPTLLAAGTSGSCVQLATLPTKLTYFVGDPFEPAGMVIQTITADGSVTPVSDYNYNHNPLTAADTTMTVYGDTYSFTFGITVGNRHSVVTLGGTGEYSNLIDAVNAVAENGTIQVLGPTSLSNNDLGANVQLNKNVTIVKSASFSDPMFTVNPGSYTLTLTTMTIDGGSYGGTLIEVTGGQVFLRGGLTLKNGQGLTVTNGIVEVRNTTLVDCKSSTVGAAIRVEKGAVNMYGSSTVSGSTDLNGNPIAGVAVVKPGDGTSNFNLHSGTISGNGTGVYVGPNATFNLNSASGLGANSTDVVYLANTTATNAYITIGVALTSDVTVQCANPVGGSTEVAHIADTSYISSARSHTKYVGGTYSVTVGYESGIYYLVLS